MRRLGALAVVVAACSWSGPAQTSQAAPRATAMANAARLFAAGRDAEALTVLKPHLGAAPDDARAWLMAAEAQFRMEIFGSAVTSFQRALALDVRLQSQTLNLGFALLKVDRGDEARRALQPFTTDSRPAHAGRAWIGLGLAADAAGNSVDAVAAWKRATEVLPQDARPWYHLGQAALGDGNTAVAIVNFDHALACSPTHHGAALGLARAHALAGHPVESAAWAARHRDLLAQAEAARHAATRPATQPALRPAPTTRSSQ